MNKNFELSLAKYNEWMLVQGWSERTHESYKSNVRFFLDYLSAETSVRNLSEIDGKALSGFQNFLYHSETKQGKRLALSSQHTKLVSVRSFFHFLYETDALFFDPSAALNLPKKRRGLPKGVMSEQQVEKLLNQPDLSTPQAGRQNPLGLRDRAILETLYSSGLRNSELRNLAVYDIDLQQLQLTVRKGKNSKDRVVPIGEIAADFIHEYLISARPKLAANTDNELLFISKNGLRLTKANLVWIFDKYVKRADLNSLSRSGGSNFTPHSLRHSCATHMLRAGADIRYIQELLGHASVATTQIYTKVEVTDLRAMHRQCHPRERITND